MTSPLSPLDDLPIHQIAEPVRHVATGDRNFYDRYYFNAFPEDGSLMLVTGMGQYPNLGVADAFAVVNDGRVHRVVRASRELGDRGDLSVGPFRIEVVEGLRRLRVVLEPNEHGLSFDLTWDGFDPAHLEPRHTDRAEHGRLIIDTCRLAQTGRWTGTVRVGDDVHEVTPDRWLGSRDRSWGIRPIGEPEAPGIRGADPLPGFFWLYAPMQFPDWAGYFVTQERPDGRRILEEAARMPSFAAGGDGEPEPLGIPEHDLTFVEGTREIERATLRLGEVKVEVTPLRRLHVGIGTGYGFDADWRHGMYQGPLVVQGKEFDLANGTARANLWGLVDSVARFELEDGTVGHGLFEYLVMGPHERYGFAGW
jgi:hypothetical protein